MGFTNVVSSLQGTLSQMSKRHVSSFCFLETNGGQKILVGKDGSLCSILRIEGVKQVVGKDEMTETVDNLARSLAPYFRKRGHAMQVCFLRDPDMAGDVVRKHNRPARNVAKSLGLLLDDVLDEREAHLPNFIVFESFYIALWTRLGVLPKNEATKANKRKRTPDEWPLAADAQDVWRQADEIMERHKAFVGGFAADLKTNHIRSVLMNAHDAVRVVRSSLSPSTTGSDWRPYLQGDPLPIRRPEISGSDVSHVLWPRLDSQICTQEAERVDGSIVKLGDRYFAGVDMVVGPQEIAPFSTMIRRMRENESEFPWRVSFLIEGDGLAGTALKKILSDIFGRTNGKNKALSDALKGLKHDRDRGNQAITALRTSFATWAPADQLGLIQERASRLANVIQSWGDCQASALSGDPLECVLSSAVAFTASSTAPAGAVPIQDAIAMLPLDRDASPWQTGSVLFKTRDGRPWPFAPGSTNQTAFIDLIIGTPGRGKSVLSNSTAMAFCLSPVATQGLGGAMLPRVAILDIGSSSSGLISLIKEGLPVDRRHEAEHFTLKNDRSNAINPFGTQLGCRRPLPSERAFLLNFFSELGTPTGMKETPHGLPELVGSMIDEIYAKFSDKNVKSTPKLYASGVDPEVDTAIDRHGLHVVSGQTFWWTIVDQLFERRDLHAAGLAQRHAVPIIYDVPGLLREPKIGNIHGSAQVGGEALIDLFGKMTVLAPKEYPILSAPTRFDVGEARVVALDLGQVAGKGSAAGDKMTALMYMVGRYVLANDFYMIEDYIDMEDSDGRFIPTDYREYHLDRFRRIRETPKRLVYDEFHRTKSSVQVREQVKIDMREGRKWGVHISLASQLIQDFDEEMLAIASGVWVLGFSSSAMADECAEKFKLSKTAREIVRHRLNGPSKDGAPFLLVLSMDDGQHEHELYNTIGPIEIWAFSTTPEDTELRSRLYDRLGAREARRRLAKAFPSGSAKGQILERTQRLVESGRMQDEAKSGVIADFVEQIVSTPY